jgi:hypothetical protein
LKPSAHPPTNFLSPSEFTQSQTAVASDSNSPEVWPPSSDMSYRGPVHSGLPHPTPSAFRVSHPLDGLRPRQPSGLISCQCHSWGFPLQGFFPSQSFPALSSWFALLALRPPLLSKPKRKMLAFRAFFPARIRHLRLRGLAHIQRPLPSWVFRLRRNSPSLQARSKCNGIPS